MAVTWGFVGGVVVDLYFWRVLGCLAVVGVGWLNFAFLVVFVLFIGGFGWRFFWGGDLWRCVDSFSVATATG